MKHIMKIKARQMDFMHDPLMPPETMRKADFSRVEIYEPELAQAVGSAYPEAEAFWHGWYPEADVRWVDYYSERSGVYDPHYVPNDLFYGTLDFALNIPRRGSQLDDKSLYDLLFPMVRQPELLGIIARGICFTKDRTPISLQTLTERCTGQPVVIKPARYTCGGFGVNFADGANTAVLLAQAVASGMDFVVQARVQQHPAMASLNATSLNTVRTMSYLRETGEVVILSAVVRIGKPGNPVDNVSSGGCSVGLTPEGCLKGVSFDHDGHRSATLPDGRPIPAGLALPGYDQMVRYIRQMHPVLNQHRLLSWDFGILPDSEPVFIETNLYRSEIDFMQLNNGPLFGSYTEEVLETVKRLTWR